METGVEHRACGNYRVKGFALLAAAVRQKTIFHLGLYLTSNIRVAMQREPALINWLGLILGSKALYASF